MITSIDPYPILENYLGQISIDDPDNNSQRKTQMKNSYLTLYNITVSGNIIHCRYGYICCQRHKDVYRIQRRYFRQSGSKHIGSELVQLISDGSVEEANY